MNEGPTASFTSSLLILILSFEFLYASSDSPKVNCFCYFKDLIYLNSDILILSNEKVMIFFFYLGVLAPSVGDNVNLAQFKQYKQFQFWAHVGFFYY